MLLILYAQGRHMVSSCRFFDRCILTGRAMKLIYMTFPLILS